MGLRNAEQEHYSQHDADFRQDEKFYRLGFEAALHAKYRCKEYDQILAEMQSDIDAINRQYPNTAAEEPFRKGFERGQNYYQSLCNQGR